MLRCFYAKIKSGQIACVLRRGCFRCFASFSDIPVNRYLPPISLSLLKIGRYVNFAFISGVLRPTSILYQNAIGSAVLCNNKFCEFGIFILDFYRVHKPSVIIPHFYISPSFCQGHLRLSDTHSNGVLSDEFAAQRGLNFASYALTAAR